MSPLTPDPLPFPKRWPWLLLGLVIGIAALSVISALHEREQTARRAEAQATLFASQLRDAVREITIFGQTIPEARLAPGLQPVINSTAATASARLHRLHATLGDDPRIDRLQAQITQVRRFAATGDNAARYAARLTASADRMAGTADAIAADQHARATLTGREAVGGAAIAVLAGMLLVAALLQHAHLTLVRAGRRQARQLQELADRDPLTGLANRRRLSEDLAALADRLDPAAPVQVLICDLDGFKALNDSLGHEAGDELLIACARRLTAATAGRGRVYRLGGDEFCVLSRPGADVTATVREALSGAGQRDPVRGSSGVALWPAEAATAREAMRLADERMYAAKDARRARDAAA